MKECRMARTLTNPLSILALLIGIGVASTASALTLTGGPVYNLPGGGSCTVTGISSQTGGASVACTGVSVGSHTHVYFGIRNNANVNGNTMTGAAPTAGSAAVFDYASSTSNSITYTSTTTISDFFNGTQPVNNQLVLTLTAGSASIVATGGTPASNTSGDIERLFLVTSSSFTVRADVKASNAFFALGQACPAVYDPTHTPASGSADVSKVDLAFYYSDCGDGQIDSPEQCDLGASNGSPSSCCTSTCTFRSGGSVCRGGVDAQCDTSETCTGSAATCPPDDAPFNGGNVCRTGSGDICDQNELCTGVPGQGCPPDDAPGKAGTVCRASPVAGSGCDENEVCSGIAGTTCPADDAPGNLNHVCRQGSGDMCDPDEKCTGVVGEGCPVDVVANPTTVCRTGSGDSCDPDEKCTAVPGATCPADVITPSGTVCRAAAGTCDIAEECSGTAGDKCPADTLAAAETPCDADNDECTVDECNGSGMCVQLSPTTCGDGATQEACGETCDDGNLDPGDGCSATCIAEATLTCTNAPLSTCLQPVRSAKASLLMKRGSTVFKDQLKWLWLAGERTTLADYGDPLNATQFTMCLYDNTGLRVHANIPAGGQCAGKPCWKAVGTTGFRYGDKDLTPDGVQKATLKSGTDGKAQIKLALRGDHVGLPDLSSIAQPVTVQIKNSNGTCWEAIYSAPPRYQSSTVFKDKAD
jgi:cysteine-rich repeat protein